MVRAKNGGPVMTMMTQRRHAGVDTWIGQTAATAADGLRAPRGKEADGTEGTREVFPTKNLKGDSGLKNGRAEEVKIPATTLGENGSMF